MYTACTLYIYKAVNILKFPLSCCPCSFWSSDGPFLWFSFQACCFWTFPPSSTVYLLYVICPVPLCPLEIAFLGLNEWTQVTQPVNSSLWLLLPSAAVFPWPFSLPSVKMFKAPFYDSSIQSLTCDLPSLSTTQSIQFRTYDLLEFTILFYPVCHFSPSWCLFTDVFRGIEERKFMFLGLHWYPYCKVNHVLSSVSRSPCPKPCLVPFVIWYPISGIQ